MAEKGHTTVWPGIAGLVIATGYLIAMLGAEKQNLIIILLAAGIVAVLAAAWLGLLDGDGEPLLTEQGLAWVYAGPAPQRARVWARLVLNHPFVAPLLQG